MLGRITKKYIRHHGDWFSLMKSLIVLLFESLPFIPSFSLLIVLVGKVSASGIYGRFGVNRADISFEET